ncbi:MAG: keto-hydroxyglutarate-aldolase/keto-deoxy-phosphogluconate aldolase, partial [Treponemataceae bacterium]|nr:keto-hydroxyglutarate-aldolase/keto-deoxy-phosphogluconate aldolase [Treponemataceae bacterium]
MEKVYEQFRDIGIIPVVAIEDASKAADLAHALVKGGLPASEVTFRTACAAEAIEAMIKAEPDMLVGAGTVLNAEKAVKAGAKFIVSPGYNP